MPPRGLYFEDFEIGQHILTAARTITESDIVSFAGLTGDYNQIHTDAEYAKGTPFGQRVAHGLLGLSYGLGLAVQTGVLEGTILAFREIGEWKFSKPTFISDTIHAELTVIEKKAYPRLNSGAVILKVEIKNQNAETMQSGKWNTLMMSRPK